MTLTDKTWSVGETLTAANFNSAIRDNFRHLWGFPKMKGADKTVSSSTTLQNDDDFFFSVAANEKWAVDMALKIDTTTAADFTFNWTVPAATSYGSAYIYSTSAAFVDYTAADAPTVMATSANQAMRIQAFFIVGATPGTVQFRWAQGAASGNTIVKAGSWMTAMRCA